MVTGNLKGVGLVGLPVGYLRERQAGGRSLEELEASDPQPSQLPWGLNGVWALHPSLQVPPCAYDRPDLSHPPSQREILSPPTRYRCSIDEGAPMNNCPRPAHVAQIYLFSKLLSYYYVPGTKDAAGNQTVKGPIPWSLGLQAEH